MLEKVFNKLSKKWTFFDKLKKPFIWLFIIFFQIGIGGIYTIVFCAYGVRDITEPWAYQYAKGRTYCGDCIAHFPEKIPKEAKNVYLLQQVSHFGSEELILSFDIDENYIDKEIKKYKYQKIIEPYVNREKERILIIGSLIPPSLQEFEKVKLYIITLKPGSGIYGIGTYNKTIMYFYSHPDL